MIILMVRRRACAVSNNEGTIGAFMVRDAAKTPLLRMRVGKDKARLQGLQV
jgi:hypothetical protein